MLKNKDLYIYSFYKFIKIDNKESIKIKLNTFKPQNVLRGTTLIADEGLNGSISGTKKDLDGFLIELKKLLKIRKLNIKINKTDFLPFNKFKIRIKKEIVSLGISELNCSRKVINYIRPSEWNDFITQKNVKLIDTRNDYEIKIGRFKSSINPSTKTFRKFPSRIKFLNIKKEDNIAMYCTGGIRCEKASSYLKSLGYKNVFQLEGGILNYIDYTIRSKTKNLWEGECFVFDDRVSVNKNLRRGDYEQCYGCRSPIDNKDKKQKEYVKGVSCPYCYNLRSEKQKNRSIVGQKQINSDKLGGKYHPFKKIRNL